MTTPSVPIGNQLLGRIINVAGEPIDGLGPLEGAQYTPLKQFTSLSPAPPMDEILETGIKVLDLFAPIPRGGVYGITALPGLGKLVVVREIIHNLAVQRGVCTVWVESNADSILQELMHEVRESGILPHIVTVLQQQHDSEEAYVQTGLVGLTIAQHFRNQGREVLLCLHGTDRRAVRELAAHVRSEPPGQGSITLLPLWETPEDQRRPTEHAGLDGCAVFSPALAKQQIWPAVDPLASRSRLLEQGLVSAEHARVAREARTLLQHYNEQQKNGKNQHLDARARRVQLFQTQPFSVAELYTARPGVAVSLDETVRDYGELVDGLHDTLPEEALHFAGTIE